MRNGLADRPWCVSGQSVVTAAQHRLRRDAGSTWCPTARGSRASRDKQTQNHPPNAVRRVRWDQKQRSPELPRVLLVPSKQASHSDLHHKHHNSRLTSANGMLPVMSAYPRKRTWCSGRTGPTTARLPTSANGELERIGSLPSSRPRRLPTSRLVSDYPLPGDPYAAERRLRVT